MKLKVNLALPNGSVCPVAITTESTTTVAEVAASVQAGLTQVPVGADQVLSLQVLSDQGDVVDTVPPRSALSETVLHSGQRVRVVTWNQTGPSTGSSAPARLHVIAGPDAGTVFPLRFGPNIIGRDESCDVTLTDQLVSRRHARLTVTDKIEIWDMNSSNGVIVADSTIDHGVLTARDPVILGDTTVIVEPNPDIAGHEEPAAEVEFNRSPLVRAPYQGKTFSVPAPPSPPKPSKFPLVAMAVPLLMGIVMFAATRSMMSILFVALSPLIAAGTWLDRKFTDGKTAKMDRDRFAADLDDLRTNVAAALEEEHHARCGEVLSLGANMEAAFSLNPDLWHRRPDDDVFLTVNLGYGRTPSRLVLDCPERGDADMGTWAQIDAVREQCSMVDDVPVVAGLRTCGNLGVAGERAWVDPVVRNLVAQLVCQHSPAEMILAGLASAESSPRWNWLMWLPHVGSTHSPLSGPHLAATPAEAGILVSGLEELVAARKKAARDAVVIPAVVVLVEDDTPVERGRLVGLAEDGPAVGVHLIWVADRHENLPAACQAYLVKDSDGRVTAGFVTDQTTIDITRIEELPEGLADGLARRLSPVLDAGAPVLDASDVPRSVSFLTLTGAGVATDPQMTVERWRENGSLLTGVASRNKTPATLKALIGQGAQGEFTLDVRTQGPHALVGGTTGAGKSEFLQSWVLGMAIGHSPQRVTFLFVDYKGGSAFADCVRLPHCVGLVTDLSPALVRRALTSLRAELQYREHLLNRKKAKDLLALERTGDVECPPALIIVVDEFAALAKEVPEFVDGVVDVAQRGRSLGLHLILATQRPAGVITANLRANTNLRVALRMADEADSTDVIDTPLASHFDPRTPGRGAVRTGPGRIALFQTGYVGGRTSDTPEPARIDIETMGFGAGTPWEIPTVDTPTDTDTDDGPTDISRIVSTVIHASQACGIPEPRKPWLPELRASYDLTALPIPTTPGERIVVGMEDDPANQDQHPVFYDPDTDGNMAVYGASGSGKSTVLRTIAYAASACWAQCRTDIYGMDFSTAGLAMIETLPTVGAVIDGSDHERVDRLLGRLVTILDERSTRYARARTGSITEYRAATGDTSQARILLLVDGYAAFRELYESATANQAAYANFTRLATEGRGVGIHIILTSERPGGIPSFLNATIQRRIVLRQADESGYMSLDVPKDVLTPASPPGRAIFSGTINETQIATPGAATTPAEQGHHFDTLAATMTTQGARPAPGIQRLAEHVALADLPVSVSGLPVLGMGEADLQPLGFVPHGGFLLTGMSGSGRTTALRTLTQSLHRWNPAIPQYYFGPSRSVLATWPEWADRASTPDEMKTLATGITSLAGQPAPGDNPGLIIVIESIADIIGGPCEAPLTDLVKLARRSGHLIIGEHEMSGWASGWHLIAEVRNDRRGLVMQPDPGDGDILFKVALPKVKRSDYPPGRGVYVNAGKCYTVQVAYPDDQPLVTPPLDSVGATQRWESL